MDQFQPFQSNEHQPFWWPGGQAAALLVHGFPGTPAELRSIAQSLHENDWAVQGLLLPGFGPQINTLFERDHAEWLSAVEDALRQLRQQHRPVLLVGYSMGAALAIQAAASIQPDGLVLLAPFWRLGTWWQQLIGIMAKPFISKMKPFKRVDFSDPGVRRGVAGFFPGVNLDDPAVQQHIRNLEIPISIFEQLHHVGLAGFRAAPGVTCPTLVLQGLTDEVVSPARTRKLARRLPSLAQYTELPAGHDLIKPNQLGWPTVQRTVLGFAQQILEQADA